MGKDGVAQRRIRQAAGNHRDLHRCHDLPGVPAKRGEAKDAIALGINERFHKAACFGK